MSKIALLGGSFNPIHNGHLAIAQLALDHFSLDKVLFIPTADHPFQKETLTVKATTRADMVEKSLAKNPQFECYRGELLRKGVSYTYDTIIALKKEYPQSSFYYIIGGDNLATFPKWYKFANILEEVTLAVTTRPNYGEQVPPEMDATKVSFFPSPEWGVSSTMIRTFIADGLSCSYLIPKAVQQYIDTDNLYRVME